MEARTVIQIPLTAGLSQKGDKRSQQPPALDICKDVEFDDLGGLRTRKPYANIGTNILGGGTITNPRKLVANGNELLLFTDVALFSWNSALSVWIPRGTYLAAKVDEAPVFHSTGDQITCDRAELNGTVVYAWADGTKTWVAAADKITGSVMMAPTAIAGAASRPRLVALKGKILLFFTDGLSNLLVYALDPATPATALAGASTTVLAANFNLYYDACQVPGTDTALVAARRTNTTQYTVATVTATLVVTSSIKNRVCDGPIAVSSAPNGAVQVVRGNGTNIQGDLLTSLLVDSITGQAIGTTATPINQITAAHRTKQNGGQYRCYAFWSYQETTSSFSSGEVKSNWIDTGGGAGAEARFFYYAGIASRAFDYNGQVYVHLVLAPASESILVASMTEAFTSLGILQNTFFLYRDDGFLVAKICDGNAAGFSAAIGHLPGVASTAAGQYSWCATERRLIPLGNNQTGYSGRAPRDVMVTFDSNEARRTARLGRTLYITGGEILQYDGTGLYEVGFHLYPWLIELRDTAAGNLDAGTYAYKGTIRWDNAVGERERSTTATAGQLPVAAFRYSSVAVHGAYYFGHKANAPVCEVWRTAKNPTADAPFYLVTNQDPAQLTNPNRYIPNDQTLFNFAQLDDNLPDASATSREVNPETGGVLESLAPPAATLVASSDTRLFLAGVAGDPDRVWYSKLRNDGEVAAFNDALVIPIPKRGGKITALAFLNETLIVCRENAIYALPGDGFDNIGGGANYGPARLIAADLGAVSQESVAVTPDGDLLFKANRGWHVLDRGWAVHYVGAGVADYDNETPLAVQVPVAQHQVRIVTSNRILVWDTLVNQWGEWTIAGGLDATIWNNTYHYLAPAGAFAEQPDFSLGTNYGMDIETAWVKPADLVGQAKIRWIMPLGEYRSAHSLRIRVSRNYLSDGAGGWLYFDDRYKDPATVVGGPVQVRHGPSIQGVEAIKIRLTASNTNKNGTPPPGEALKLTGIGLEIGVAPGLFKLLAQAQKQ